MTILEGLWNCAECRTTGIPGHLTECPNCHDPRKEMLDRSEEVYLPTNARIVTDTAELQQANAGPNWNCGFCGTQNRATDKVCSDCGKPLSSDDFVVQVRNYVSGKNAEGVNLSDDDQLSDDRGDAILTSADKLQELEKGPVSLPERTLSMNALPRQGRRLSYESVPPDESPSSLLTLLRERPMQLRLGVLALAAAVVLFGGWFIYGTFIRTRDVKLQVQSLSWQRQVEVEAYKTLTLQDWTVPADGRVIESHQAIRSYVQVFDHNEQRSRQVGERVASGSHTEQYVCGSKTVNKGNGYFSSENTYCTRTVTDYTTQYHTEYYDVPIYRSKPVYDTQYTYQVDRWVTDHFVTAKGDTDPYWPTFTPSNRKERVGNERHENYQVNLTDQHGRRFQRSTDLTTWSRLYDGESLHGQENHQGSLKNVDWPVR